MIENTVKPAAVQSLRQLDASYEAWMATVYYRAEPHDPSGASRLPRPASSAR